MKRIAIFMALIIGFSGMAAATNGQTDAMYREIADMSDLITTIQGDLDKCGERDKVCRELAESADVRKDLSEAALRKAQAGDTEGAMETLKEVRAIVRNDIETLEEQDLSDDKVLSRVLEIEYDLERTTNKALKRENTIGLVSLARQCPEKCGPQVSQKATEAQDYNSSRSNKPRS